MSTVKEIERKWIAYRFDAAVLTRSFDKIQQGHFSTGGSPSARVRITNNKSAEVTVKDGDGAIRTERNETIGLKAARMLLNFGCKYRLDKVRHTVGKWEVDIIDAPFDGLIIVEREFPTTDTRISGIPDWFGGIEVTGTISYRDLAVMAYFVRREQIEEMKASRAKLFEKYELVMDCVAKIRAAR